MAGADSSHAPLRTTAWPAQRLVDDQAQGDLLGAAQPAAEAPWYQQYLHPEFRNNLPAGDELRKIRVTKVLPDNTRSSLKGDAHSVEEIMNKIRNRRPDWLAPGSIVTVEPAA